MDGPWSGRKKAKPSGPMEKNRGIYTLRNEVIQVQTNNNLQVGEIYVAPADVLTSRLRSPLVTARRDEQDC